LRNELKKEKELIKKYKEAAETEITVLKNNIEQLEKQKQEIQKRHEAEIGGFMDNYNAKLQSIRREVLKADAAGYKRGIDEMLRKR
jgi:predicted  nucleic acid-binding Zn-ribbon protein